MLTAQQVSLFFTVAMLAVTTYFLFGSIPLLILKHDNTMDSKFIRSFYVTYFKFAIVVSSGAALSYAAATRPLMAAIASAILTLTLVLRFKFIPQMDQIGSEIRDNNLMAIPEFRKIHKTAITLNLAQLITVLTSLGFM
jgi:membrane glycosyltransferase